MRREKGITLVALVVTIIILIILAGVSINLVLGENGIITMAKRSKENVEKTSQEESKILSDIEAVINNETNINIKTLKQSGKYLTAKTIVLDTNGNKIVIPQGFKVASDSGINVTEGIVIEDNDIINGIGNNRGNQYVWIPVGTGIKKSDGTSVDITLGRYTFADGINHKDTNGNSLDKGTPILKQNAENYANETEINVTEIDPTTSSNYAFKELATSRIGVESDSTDGLNTTALNLKGFIDSVKANGGYYIARYEASYGTDGKVNSKISTGTPATSDGSSNAPTTEGILWNNISQIDAATASRGLYTTAITDLINSYAWDTAIVYIQEFSGYTDYSYQISKNKNRPANTGRTDDTKDEVCKINDMSSNTLEWVTENSTKATTRPFPCTCRGGVYHYTGYSSNSRIGILASGCYMDTSFRSTLYI